MELPPFDSLSLQSQIIDLPDQSGGRKMKVFIPEEVIYSILLWLPVKCLLRFKLITRSWRTLIESNDFIKGHLHHNHENPILKDKNQNHHLIYRVPGNFLPITFLPTSVDSFEEPRKCMQLSCSDRYVPFPVEVYDVVSFDGIVCLNIYDCNYKQWICIWNPATKESRFLPPSPFPVKGDSGNTVGFGFDAKASEYKVVNFINNHCLGEERFQIYSLSRDSWRRVTTDLPPHSLVRSSRMPFNKGTSFCWVRSFMDGGGILCFDFVSETSRSLSFPDVESSQYCLLLGIVSDKIACVFDVGKDRASGTDVWVLIGYGSVNETWVKHCRIYSMVPRNMCEVLLSRNGEYLIYKSYNQLCRYNLMTRELKFLPRRENREEILNGFPLPHPITYVDFHEAIFEFKESLVSIW